MQITPNMPEIIVSLIQFLDKLTKYNVPFFKTSIQTNYHVISRETRKYYDIEGAGYDSTIMEHINRNDGRMSSAYDALVRRNIIIAPDEWDIAKLNDLSYKIKEVLNFLNQLTQGGYSEDTMVYYEFRVSRGKTFDEKSKLIYLHVPTMIKLIVDPQVNSNYNLCDIVTCYPLSSFKSIEEEFINCSLPYSNIDLSTLLNSNEQSKTWKNFVFDSTRINAKKFVEKPKPVIKNANSSSKENSFRKPTLNSNSRKQVSELSLFSIEEELQKNHPEIGNLKSLYNFGHSFPYNDDWSVVFNHYNFLISYVFKLFFEGKLNLKVRSFVWEIDSIDRDYFDPTVSLFEYDEIDELNSNLQYWIKEANGISNLHKYFINRFEDGDEDEILDIEDRYCKALDCTIFRLTIEDGTQDGFKLELPYIALNKDSIKKSLRLVHTTKLMNHNLYTSRNHNSNYTIGTFIQMTHVLSRHVEDVLRADYNLDL